MTVVTARLTSTVLDGIDVMRAPVGKLYRIDLDSRVRGFWFNAEHGHQRALDIVLDAEQGGYLPCELLEVITA